MASKDEQVDKKSNTLTDWDEKKFYIQIQLEKRKINWEATKVIVGIIVVPIAVGLLAYFSNENKYEIENRTRTMQLINGAIERAETKAQMYNEIKWLIEIGMINDRDGKIHSNINEYFSNKD